MNAYDNKNKKNLTRDKGRTDDKAVSMINTYNADKNEMSEELESAFY